MIQFQNIYKTYGPYDALHNLSLTIHESEMVFIQGHSGAGKSTLLRLLALIEPASSGTISIGDKNLNTLSGKAILRYRRSLGLIFQDPMLLHQRSVFDNVALPLIISGFQNSDIQRRVQAALNRVGLLSKAHALPKTLSSGEQQRVSIARAIVHKPRILMADEPTGNLDPDLAFEIMRLFERFKQVGVTVIIASHAASLMEQFPYRRIALEKGHLKTENLNQEKIDV